MCVLEENGIIESNKRITNLVRSQSISEPEGGGNGGGGAGRPRSFKQTFAAPKKKKENVEESASPCAAVDQSSSGFLSQGKKKTPHSLPDLLPQVSHTLPINATKIFGLIV